METNDDYTIAEALWSLCPRCAEMITDSARESLTDYSTFICGACATEQMRAQTNPRIVSDALGHATVAFTMQAYSHPDERMARVAAEAIEAAFSE